MNWKKAPTPTVQPPKVACAEHEPEEPAPKVPRTVTVESMGAYARRWMGVATAEVTKRRNTANCLDQLRKDGVIR